MLFGGIFDLDAKRRRIAELESDAGKEGFWDDRDKAQRILRETKSLKALVESVDRQAAALADAEVLLELATEAQDGESVAEASSAADSIREALEDMEFRRMLSGESDPMGAVVEIKAGAGGVDAADWAQMLMRMLLRYAQKRSWKVSILDEQPAEEAGIRGATLVIEGDYAFGLLHAEDGVHRLVRISPFDQNARRQTSFAAVWVTPDIDDDIEVDINESDLRVDTYRAGGAGGQKVNKTDSAVRITHLPTGIVAQCQNERSQHKNRSAAMRVLRSRLYEHFKALADVEAAKSLSERQKIDFGSQIRSYVLAPYQLVTDHRTDLKIGNVTGVLDGDLDPFIREFLLQTGSTQKE